MTRSVRTAKRQDSPKGVKTAQKPDELLPCRNG